MELLPRPLHTQPLEGTFVLRCGMSVTLADAPAESMTAARFLQREIREAAGLELPILRSGTPGGLALRCDPDLTPREIAYRLRILPDGIGITGRDPEALQWGVMTLAQLVRLHGGALPCLEIGDAPRFARRGYLLDVSRGRVPTLAQLKRTADTLALLKINEWQLYVEHTYLFRGQSEAWRGDTPLTAEDILELDAYCRDLHIELVPALACFGHMQRMLSTRTNEALSELPGADRPRFLMADMMLHHTLNPADPRSLPFALGLIDEYRALFTSRRFNICCDETFDLGKGRSAASGTGEKELYIGFVAALCRHLLEQGVTPQFWGDILLRQPETAVRLPEGTVCLNWGYAADVEEAQAAAIARTGLPQMMCPGISSWNRLIPDYGTAFRNIRAMSGYGLKYGALGILNTDWGDFGHLCDPLLALPGIACGAAFAWDPGETDAEELYRRAGRLLYGPGGAEAMDALLRISACERFSWWDAVLWAEAEDGAVRDRHLAGLRQAGRQPDLTPSREIAAALADLNRTAPSLNECGREMLRAAHIAAEGIDILERAGDCAAFGPRDRGTAVAGELETWFRLFSARWREVAREGQLKETFRVIETWADRLRGRDRENIAGTL